MYSKLLSSKLGNVFISASDRIVLRLIKRVLAICCRYVVHFEPPDKPDIFVHRSGRAGRAGKKGTNVLLVEDTSGDINQLRVIADVCIRD